MSWSGKSRGGSIGYLLFHYFIKFGGLWSAYLILKFVAFYFLFTAPSAVKSIYFYFRKALGYGRIRSCFSVYMNFVRLGETVIDRMAVTMGMRDRFKFKFVDEPVLRKSVESEDGCLMISAHIGNWQVAQAFLNRFSKNRVNIVMLDVENEKIKEHVKNIEGGENVHFIFMNDGMNYLLDIVKAFRNKEVVCLHGDRFLEGARIKPVKFFGMDADFPDGPFSLGKKFKVPSSFTFVMKTGRTEYSFYATEAKVYTDLNEMREDYVRELERIVKMYPYQWFNFHKFWRDQ
jgi:predicted LPLAT superfamily acyltransferase